MSTAKGTHVMLSYQWDSQELVKKIHRALTERGVTCWLDIAGGMKGNINSAMAEGVEGAAVICPLMTAKYQASRNCSKELNYADQQSVPIVPLMGEVGYRAQGWLGAITAGALYYDFSQPALFDERVAQLIQEIRGIAPHVFLKGPDSKPIAEWSIQDVSEKLKQLGLDTYAQVFSESMVDGRMLLTLTDDDLIKELGMKPLLVKRFRTDMAQYLQPAAAPAAAAATPASAPSAPSATSAAVDQKQPAGAGASATGVSRTNEAGFLAATELSVIRAFLDAGVPIEAKTKDGDTALILACRRGDTETVRLLASRGANVNAGNRTGSTPLVAAAMRGHLEIVKILIERGANVNQHTQNDDSALSLACWKNHTDVALLLISKGANVAKTDRFDDNPLLDSSKNNNLRVAEALIATGRISIDHQNQTGNTALHQAAQAGHPDMVRLLLRKGCNPTIKNKEGKTALGVATDSDCTRILNEAMGKTDVTKAKQLLAATTVDAIRALIKSGVSVETQDEKTGDFPLNLACRRNDVDTVKMLISEFGCNVNSANLQGQSALMACGMRDHSTLAKILLDAGAVVNHRSKAGDSALSLAVWKNNTATAKLLIENGANVTFIDKFGELMLHDAAKNGNVDLVNFFLDRQLDVNHQNNNGETPLHKAAANGSDACVSIMLKRGADTSLKTKEGKSIIDVSKPSCRVIIEQFQKEKAVQQQQQKEAIAPMLRRAGSVMVNRPAAPAPVMVQAAAVNSPAPEPASLPSYRAATTAASSPAATATDIAALHTKMDSLVQLVSKQAYEIELLKSMLAKLVK